MGKIKDRDRKTERQRAGVQISLKEKLSTSSKKKDEIPQLMREPGHGDYPL